MAAVTLAASPSETPSRATQAAGSTQTAALIPPTGPFHYEIVEFPVPQGSHPHDVAPAPDGAVWYTAQAAGELGKLDPKTGKTHHIALGQGSAPHGVIVGPDNAPWITD
jgi:virginiamycin B lyase